MSDSFGHGIEDTWNRINPVYQWSRCLACDKDHSNCLHHNYGRNGGDKIYNSILNSVPLNNAECHLPNHSAIKDSEEWLVKTFKIVERAVRQGIYSWKKKDYDFYKLKEPIYLKHNLLIHEYNH